MRTQHGHQVRPVRPLPRLPGFPECTFTKPLVVEMPGRCPKCGGRLMKRTGKSQKTGKQYTYYCCEFGTSRDEEKNCDFMTWDVPKDDCPVCGQTMFKKAGKGFKKPFCINPACENFLPEDKRGFVRKKAADAEAAEEKPAKRSAAKKTTAKTAAKAETAAKKTAVQKEATAKRQKRTAQKGGKSAESGRKQRQKRPPPKRRQRRKRTDQVTVIGAGLAGCEAAWQLARRGIAVTLCRR